MKVMFLQQSPRDPNRPERHDRVEALLRSYASPGTELDLCYPDDFPGARVFETMSQRNELNGLYHFIEAGALARKIVWAEENGYDAVVQSNTFDPGVDAARLAVSIPVIGLFKSSIHWAATLASRIGIVVPMASHVPHTWSILREFGMADHVVSMGVIGIYGKDLSDRKGEVLEHTVEAMQKVLAAGAEIVIPLGGALIPYQVDTAELEALVHAPVVNTKRVGIKFAENCVSMGASHSPIAYPKANLTTDDFDGYGFK